MKEYKENHIKNWKLVIGVLAAGATVIVIVLHVFSIALGW